MLRRAAFHLSQSRTRDSFLRSLPGSFIIGRPASSAQAVERLVNDQNVSSNASLSAHTLIQMTEACAQRILDLGRKQNRAPILRISVSGGGCSGFQYEFALDDKVGPEDTVIESQGAQIVVDDISLPFLSGAILDFESSMIRSAFKVVENPHAASSCGCGSSFNPK